MDGDPNRCIGKIPAPPTAARLFHDEIRGFPSPPCAGVGLFIGVEILL